MNHYCFIISVIYNIHHSPTCPVVECVKLNHICLLFVCYNAHNVVFLHFQAASQIVATILQLSRVKSPTLSPKTNPVSYNEVNFLLSCACVYLFRYLCVWKINVKAFDKSHALAVRIRCSRISFVVCVYTVKVTAGHLAVLSK